MYLPNRELAQVPEKKLSEYLLFMAHFDRLVGRPWREDPVEAIDVAAKPAQAGLP